MKEIVLDTETTGISVQEGHRIVEIGCIELENLIPTKNKFHCYLNPERKVSEKALEVHGYTDVFLSTQKKFAEIGDKFLDAAFAAVDITDWKKYVLQDERYMRPAEVAVLCGDSTKAKEKLGWTPTTPFEEMVSRMVKNDIKLLS